MAQARWPSGRISAAATTSHGAGGPANPADVATTVSRVSGPACSAMLTSALTASPDFNRRLAVAASGVDVAYPAGEGDHPLTGWRVPNLKLADGSDVFGRLAAGRFVLTGVAPGDLAEQAGPDTQDAMVATADGFAAARAPWDTVAAALIRPDGHLAWAAGHESGPDTGPTRAAGAAAALRRWLPGRHTASR